MGSINYNYVSSSSIIIISNFHNQNSSHDIAINTLGYILIMSQHVLSLSLLRLGNGSLMFSLSVQSCRTSFTTTSTVPTSWSFAKRVNDS